MTDAASRLRTARLEAGFKTASEAARFHGWNENTYRSHENGERGLKGKIAARYAYALKVDDAWLLTGKGRENKVDVLFISGFVMPGGVIRNSLSEDEKKITISLPTDVPPSAKCYLVETDALNPRYANGDVILTFYDEKVHEEDLPLEGVAHVRGSSLFGNLLGGHQHGFSIESIGTQAFRTHDVDRFEPLELVVRRGRLVRDGNFPSFDPSQTEG